MIPSDHRLAKPYDENLYRARMVRVLDGDTFEMDLDLGQKVSLREHCRLALVQAWETTLGRLGATVEDVTKGKALKEKLAAEFLPGAEFVCTMSKRDKYGRVLCTVYYRDPNGTAWICLNARLLAEGVPGIDDKGRRIG